LPPELEKLFAAERRRPDPSPELRQQLWAGVATGLSIPAPPSPAAPPAATAASGAVKAAAIKISLGKAVAIGVLSVGVGGTGVAILDRAARHAPAVAPTVAARMIAAPVRSAPQLAPAPQAPAVQAVQPSAPDVARTLGVAPTPTLRPTPAVPSAAPTHRAPRLAPSPVDPQTTLPRAAPPDPHDASLAAERALLDRARTALVRGRPSEAFEATLEHEVDFGDGRLLEERQVLQIQALLGLGRQTEAKRLAEAFRQSHPDSLLLPAVDQALR